MWATVAFVEASAHAASADGTPRAPSAASSASGGGAAPGEGTSGFDVTGSHPLPNANDREAPGGGACGCRLGRSRRRIAPSALLALLLAVGSRRRRSVS